MNSKKSKLQKNKEDKVLKAAALITKYQDNEQIKALLTDYYGDDIFVLSKFGNIDFSPNGKSDIVGGEKLTYDDYLDIQFQSSGKQRSWFEMCYHNIPVRFMGCIEKKAKKNICFKRIYVSGIYPDGECFEGKEDHVWMNIHGFEGFEVGDSISFYAEVYRYIKTGNGKVLDYSLRNPYEIEQIDSYPLPSDKDILMQSIDQIICETCYFSEHCNQTHCLRNQDKIQTLKGQRFSTC